MTPDDRRSENVVHVPGRANPHPFRQFLLKVHSRCNLACDYCYVYTKADQRWVDLPRAMSPAVVRAAAWRIAEHAAAHRLPWVSVVLHGGEPLLAGPDALTRIVRTVRETVGPDTEVRFSMQTNGVLLDEQQVALLRALGVRIAVSVDGGREAHDRHRRQRDGSGSFRRVEAALHELMRPVNAGIYAGLLVTVDLDNDPVGTYEELLRFRPPMIDLLLPEGNWSAPPPGREPHDPATPYADWLTAVFDRWYDAPAQETRIRFFTDIVDVLLGGRASVVGVGLAPQASVVVQTDGRIEVCDALTATRTGSAATGLAVAPDPFDDALCSPLVAERQGGAAALSPVCRSCPELEVCGGGVHTQRFDERNGFRNPSVYCPDLFALIGHVRRRLSDDIARARRPAVAAR